jgi:hypothetical protein
LTSLARVCEPERARRKVRHLRRCPVVSFRRIVTAPTPLGARGDVCPETARARHLRKIVTAMSVGVTGAQDGPKAFAAERREVPT